ncbi:hypothetical protein C450_18754 [Halococcus salifodinae DSM 8989]|uniref:Uncharacterized protein n=1 Tax=Halococcus salifodinae DSM 8989 TaxID=1227456 RepID=M0MUS7_9EURY|nr:hypothetical protein C450_18754 [Halococcus salifodinae DSM 8989]
MDHCTDDGRRSPAFEPPVRHAVSSSRHGRDPFGGEPIDRAIAWRPEGHRTPTQRRLPRGGAS